MKKRKLGAFFFIILVYITAMVLPASAESRYGYPGYECYKTYLASGRVIIGDSRTCQMWRVNHKSGSYLAVWSGHYSYGGSTYQIDNAERIAKMKLLTRKTICKKGYCKIFIFATINDYDGGSYYQHWADKVIALAEQAWGWKYSYKGKGVRPQVYVVSLVPNKNKGANVANFNNYLKARAKSSSKIKGYIDVIPCIGGVNGGYLPDKCHYTTKSIKAINAKIMSY